MGTEYQDEFSEFDSDAFFTNPNVKAEFERRIKNDKTFPCISIEAMSYEEVVSQIDYMQAQARLILIEGNNKNLTKEDIIRLCDLTQEPSIKMPEGLSREQRREWAASVASLYSTLDKQGI